MSATVDLGLADADRLDEHDVVRRRPRSTCIVSRVARATPPSVPAVGDGRMNAFGSTASRAIRVLSPRMHAAGARRGRVDREHRRPGGPAAVSIDAERVDERRLADARHAGDADPDGLARRAASSETLSSSWAERRDRVGSTRPA